MQAWRDKKQQHLIACAGCVLSTMQQYRDEERACTRCNQKLPLAALNTAVDLVSQHGDAVPVWSPVTLRIFLDRGENSVQWLCYNCLHPACSVSSCRERPRFPARRMPDATEPYLCNVCLWPLCSGGCGAERPRETRCRVTNMAQWYCSQCKPESKRFCYVTSCFNYGLVPSVGTFV